MRTGALLPSILGMAILSPILADASPVTVSGRNVAFASTVSTAPFGEVLTATIRRGRSRTVLSIDAALDGYLGSSTYIIIIVNGFSVGIVQPSFTADAVCRQSGLCTVSGQFWLDVDTAEAASPGTFVGQPIDVDLYINSGGEPNYFASLRVRMDKK